MTSKELMQKIEGHRFAALANLASEFRTFLRIVSDQPEVQALSGVMRDKAEIVSVFIRLHELAASPVDGDYEHPADTAMAAYLWLLSMHENEFCGMATETVLQCKNCWWSRKMAGHVRNTNRFRSGAPLVRNIVFAGGGVALDYTAHVGSSVASINSMTQLAGRVSRMEPLRKGVIYPLVMRSYSGTFKNHDTQNQPKELLAGR